MNPRQTLGVVIGALRSEGIEYMVTGSVAGSYHGVPRSTQDIDLIVDGTEEQLLGFVRALSDEGFYVSEPAVREAVESRGRFNVIDRRNAWKVDLILRKDREFSRTEFSRRRREEALGLSLWLTTAEDMIVAKLEWAGRTGSERQIDDVVGILGSQGEDLDRTYVEKWVSELGVEDEWRRALERRGGRE